MPKKLQETAYEKNNDSRPIVLTNVKSEDNYFVESINYFIEAPIELHILAGTIELTIVVFAYNR